MAAPAIWANLGDGVSGPGLAQLVARLREDLPDLSATITAPRGTADRVPALCEYDLREQPLDPVSVATGFAGGAQPRVAIVTGRDHLPAATSACRRRGIATLLLDSDPAGGQGLWGRVEHMRNRGRLRAYDRIVAVSPEAGQRLIRAGVDPDRIEVIGPLAAADDPPPCNEAERDALATAIGTRPVWLADAHVAEETDRVEEAHRQACRMSHRLLLIVVPRNPRDAGAIAAQFRDRGWVVHCRSQGDDPTAEAQVYIADDGPEGSLWLRLSPICFLGGSFSDVAAGDPVPPGLLGSAIVHGPRLSGSEARFAPFRRAKATRLVANAANLGNAIAALLAPDEAALLASRGWEVSTRSSEAQERIATLILDRLGAG